MLTVAIAAATAGWAAGSAIQSPSEVSHDARPPEPSLITAPVERRILSTEIVTRGDAVFATSTELVVEAGTGSGEGGRPVVTGRVPEVGAELAEGSIVLEVSGRPVLLLSGSLPMYRDLTVGAAGEDVRQLEAALARLGFLAGQADTTFDAGTAAAVDRWYGAAGYESAGPSAEEQARLAAARQQARAAGDALAAAATALDAARQPPGPVELVAAEGEVQLARAQLDKARADREAALAEAAPEDQERIRQEQDLLVLAAEIRLETAEAQLAALTAPPDATAEQAAVDRAAEDLKLAEAELRTAQTAAGPRLPRGEVVFLPDLPRRVEQVAIALGDEPSGPVLTLSGADLLVEADITVAERSLVSVGDEVKLAEESLGIDLTGTVVAISESPGESGTHTVRIRPAGSGSDDLAGVNVRVAIPVESTGGEVLAVPVAAVTTAADGRSRVRVVGPTGTDVVVVQVGLAAEGYLEVTPVEGVLAPGDQVVLGLQ